MSKRKADFEYSQQIDTKQEEPVFSKAQLVKSKTYRDVQDILMVVLKDDKQYTHSEVKKLIKEFKERVI